MRGMVGPAGIRSVAEAVRLRAAGERECHGARERVGEKERVFREVRMREVCRGIGKACRALVVDWGAVQKLRCWRGRSLFCFAALLQASKAQSNQTALTRATKPTAPRHHEPRRVLPGDDCTNYLLVAWAYGQRIDNNEGVKPAPGGPWLVGRFACWVPRTLGGCLEGYMTWKL